MSDNDREKRRLNWLVLIMLLLVLYILSVGPVGGMFRRDIISRETYSWIANTIYAPLMYACSFEIINDFFNWYVALFDP